MPDNFSESSAYPAGTNYRGGLVQQDQLDPKTGKQVRRAIQDAGMGRDVIKTLIQANRNRNIVNSRVLAKYNAERPYEASKLENEGLGWRQNFTTKPLPAMIEKVAPRFTAAINGLKYLTNASLSNKWLGAAEKTEKFRELITKTIRARKGWRTLIEDIAFTNALFGHVVVAILDEFSWMPKAFAQDESFLADGTPSEARLAQIIALKETWLPHELFKQIEDRESAETVGWEIKSTIAQINKASPAQLRDRLNVGGTLETFYQNMVRELTLGASYMAGASVVVAYSLLVVEDTGKVSHYRFAGPDQLEVIFQKEDRFESMESCASFFAFQRGNGRMHGSKGIGRDIYELAGMQDRSRNEIVDRAILSGKTMIQGDVKRIHTFKMHVLGAMVVIPQNWTVLEQKIDGNVEPFLKLDAYFQMLVDQLIGSTSPPRQEGEAFRSPAAWNLLAQREEEGKDAKIGRFLEQFTDLMGLIQKRLCDSETVEDDAKAMQKELLEIMTRKELDELANQPVAGTVRDMTPMERQLVVQTATEKKGNPLYNQRQLEVEDLTARVGADFANRVLLPENDPTEQAEQMRLQQMEAALLSLGQPVPVSPRDNHMIHLQVLMPLAEQAGGAVAQGKANTGLLEAMLSHITEHYNRAVQQGVPKEKLKEVADLVKNAGKVLAKLKELDAKAQEHAQTSAEHDNEPMPPEIAAMQSMNGQPPA